MIKKHNILDRIIKHVLSEQTLTIPVTIKKFSVNIGEQVLAEELGAVFAFQVTAKSKEQKVDDAGTKVKLTPTDEEVLQAITQRLNKTEFPEIVKYKTGNYWWIQSANISKTTKMYDYVFFVFPKATIVGVMNPIVPNNLNEFPPKVDYYIGATAVTKADSDHFDDWADGELLPSDEWLENNASRNEKDYNKALGHAFSILTLGLDPDVRTINLFDFKQINQRIRKYMLKLRGLKPGIVTMPRTPEYLNRKDEELFDAEITLYDQPLKFTGTDKYVRSVGDAQVRKYIGFFKDDVGDIVLRATVLINGQDGTTIIQTGIANNLEIENAIYFTGNITNDKRTQGTVIDSTNNVKYVGTFDSKGIQNNGLEYKNDELVRIWENGENWDYVKNSTVTNESSQYQIRELQTNIIKMWNNNSEFVASTARNNKYLINKFIQNGVTGIWDTPTKDMVTALNLIFTGPDPDTGKPYDGSDKEIRAQDHELIVKYGTTKISTQ